MERTELEALDRDALIARAKGAGVAKAQVLTRPELIDELLVRTAFVQDEVSIRRARGFFGRARDLLARVVERGLHLPDAAEIIRSARSSAPPPARTTAILPTVTLAEIYATQGHRDRAVETLRRVLEHEPEHAAARALLRQLEDAAYVAPPPPLPPEEEGSMIPRESESDVTLEPRIGAVGGAASVPLATANAPAVRSVDEAPLAARDACVAIPVDPSTLFVSWEICEATLSHLRAARPGGVVSLRLVVVIASWDGPRTTVIDHDVLAPVGDWVLRDLHRGAVPRAAIGWRVGDAFLPLAHSPALEALPGAASGLRADVLVRWTGKGAFAVSSDDPDADAIRHALDLARARVASDGGAPRTIWGRERFAGSSVFPPGVDGLTPHQTMSNG